MDKYERDSSPLSALGAPFRKVKELFSLIAGEDDRLRSDAGLGSKLGSFLTLPFRLAFAFIVFMVQAWTTSRNGFAFLRGLPAAFTVFCFLAALWGVNYFSDRIAGQNLARYFLAQKDYPDKPEYAEGYIEKVVELLPDNVSFKYELALAKERSGEIEAARDIMKTIAIGARMDDDEDADPSLNRQLEQLNYDMDANTSVSLAHVWLGNDYLNSDQLDMEEDERAELARQQYEYALAVNDENREAMRGLADYYERKDNLEKSVEYLTRLITVGGLQDVIQVEMIPRQIKMLIDLEREDEALLRLRKSVELIQPLARRNPDSFRVWGTLVDSAALLKDYELANEIIDDALQFAKAPIIRDLLSRLKARVFVLKSLDQTDMNDRDQYIGRLYDLCEAIKASPSSPEPYNELVEYMVPDESNPEHALWMRESLVGCPFPAIVHILLGLQDIDKGEFPLAQRRWKTAEFHFNMSQYLVNNLIEAYSRKETGEEGEERINNILTVAMQMFPEQPVYYQTRGRLRIRTEQFAAALPDFEQALEFEPNLVSARIGLVEAYRGMEQHEKAREQLDIIRSTPSGLNEFLQLQLDAFLKEQAQLDELLEDMEPQAG